MTLRIGIVAGEPSGDLLGAAILQALHQHYAKLKIDLDIIGIAGPKMIAAGAKTLFPMEKLTVMGFSEVLLRARDLLRLRAQVKNYFLKNPPDIYIGVDAPDFNLPIEIRLKYAGIKTVHCNSPTIWAWRKKRIYKIGRAVNLMLTLFPFEPKYYQEANIPVEYIGHPLADIIPLEPDPAVARQKLNIPNHKKIIALLPGSRHSEIKYIGPVLLQAAKILLKQYPDVVFISPMINQTRHQQFEQQWKAIAPELPLLLFDGQSHDVMAAADIVVLASGTATLEAMLLKRPMVVVYRGSNLTYWIVKQLVTIREFSLPNILAGETLVPEFIQHQATAENIADSVSGYINHPERVDILQKRFLAIHQELRRHASEKAALAISQLLTDKMTI